MPHRVSPTERVRGHIDELFASDPPLPEILEDVARLGAQLLLQAALEAEVTDYLGRNPCRAPRTRRTRGSSAAHPRARLRRRPARDPGRRKKRGEPA
jgi:putative transposase